MLLVLTIAYILVLIYWCHKRVSRRYNYWKQRNVPYIKPQPFVGNLMGVIQLKQAPGQYFHDLLLKNRELDFFGVYLFNKPALVLKGKEIIRNVLVKDFDCFANRPLHVNPYDKFSSQMIPIVRDSSWKCMRQKTTAAFSTCKLKNSFLSITEQSKKMMNYLNKKQDIVIDALDLAEKYQGNTMANCFFSVEENAFENENADFLVYGKRIFGFNFVISFRFICYWLFPKIVDFFNFDMWDPKTTKFTKEAIWGSINARKTTNARENNVVDFLINLENDETVLKKFKYDEVMVAAQAFALLAGGFETSSSVLSFTLYELAMNPKIQERLREEITEAFKIHKELRYEWITKLPYLHMTIQETLRRYPVVPVIDRMCNKDYNIPGTSVIIEKGTAVLIPVYGLHHDADDFPDPFKYDPERFANPANIPFTYLPFGAGQRKCLAYRFGLMTIKVALVQLLSKYECEPTPKTPKVVKFKEMSFTTQPKHKMIIRLKRR